MEDNGSKAQFFRSVQVYPEDLVGVMMHQDGGSAQSFLKTLEEYESCGVGGLSFVLDA